jgi:hypothetical protein
MAKKKEVIVPETQPATVAKTNWPLIIILFLIGLVIIGIALWRSIPNAEAVEVCPDGGAWQKDDSSYGGFDETCYSGKKVTEICIKGGTQIAYYTTNGNNGCWARSGIGTNEGDAWKIGAGPTCPDISHASFKCEYVSPTPTPTKTPTPTTTPTPTNTPTPTPTEPPVVCEQKEWSCDQCQTLNDDVCYKDQETFCSGEFGYQCHWTECEENGDFKLLDAVCESEWVCDTPCKDDEPPPPATRQSEPPVGCTQNCGVPACTDTVPKEVANPHVYRNGDCAIVKWMPTEGDKANIYWKENSSGDWQHSLIGIENTGYREVCGLSTLDYTFGVQSVNGCAADGIVNASNLSVIVDGATSDWILFR